MIRRPAAPVAAALLPLLLFFQACDGQGSLPGREAYRTAEWAGRYYPQSRDELAQEIERSLALATRPAALEDGARATAMLVPHAAYDYTSATLGKGFGALRFERFERVFILGQSHAWERWQPVGRFVGMALPAEKGFALATGTLDNDLATIERLSRDTIFQRRARAFDGETAIEPLLPFIQALWPEATIVPMLIGQLATVEESLAVAKAIGAELDEKSLLVISTTFTHFDGRAFPISPDKARTLAALRAFEEPFIEAIARRDVLTPPIGDAMKRRLCGFKALALGLAVLDAGRATEEGGTQLQLLSEDWSLREAPEPLDPKRASGVSYRAILFTQGRGR
ncbi:MAG: AmmeMemoRadiSam system protein B [Myxococcales bacterium]|jgi:AmmeMemoRadiSam system protein B|nr:AmmeMemoRadiSam system protein B [Myxococcales bacterium]